MARERMANMSNFINYKYRHKIGIPEQDANRLEAALNKQLAKTDKAYIRNHYIRKYTHIALLIKHRRKTRPHTRP
jgi:hypothetical protein